MPDVQQPDVFIIDDAGMAFLIETGAGQRWTDREYVYGPDDVDEFLVQIDASRLVTHFIRVAKLNVMVLLAGDSPGRPIN